jgi:hypothetical protein
MIQVVEDTRLTLIQENILWATLPVLELRVVSWVDSPTNMVFLLGLLRCRRAQHRLGIAGV